MGPLIPLFWTSGDVSSGFQSQSKQHYSHLVEAYVLHVPWDSSYYHIDTAQTCSVRNLPPLLCEPFQTCSHSTPGHIDLFSRLVYLEHPSIVYSYIPHTSIGMWVFGLQLKGFLLLLLLYQISSSQLMFCSVDVFGNGNRYLIAGSASQYPIGWIRVIVSVPTRC